MKPPFQTHDILVPLHLESDSCDHSGVGIFSCKKSSWKTLGFCASLWRKNFLTLFGDHIIHLAILKNISVASWRLPKKIYFGPCMSILKIWVSWKQRPPYFSELRNYHQPVANATESWALVTRILRLLLVYLTDIIRGIFFVLNWKILCVVSSKELTPCLFEVFNFHRK